MHDAHLITIGELARLTGLPVKTLPPAVPAWEWLVAARRAGAVA